MGEVYRARDTRLGREVAIKVLPEEMAGSPERLARFEREARTVAGLNHPNIVTLHSVEEEQGTHFLTMELVDGTTLDQLITSDGMPLGQILDIMVPLADALVAAHEKGVVHRDLKPSNVMLTRDRRVKVLDFGLAKLTAESASPANQSLAVTAQSPISGEGQVLGTVPYMAPEQVRGEEADARTDLFALGVMLYEMSSGSRPFEGGSTADLSSSILRDTPAALRQVRGDVPEELDAESSRAVSRRMPETGSKRRSMSATSFGVCERAWRDESRLKRRALLETPSPFAVLPFVNRSREEEDEYFSDGLADELLGMLAKIRGLRVAAPHIVFHVSGEGRDHRRGR